MAYERIDWENEPSVDSPINEDNLNHMEDGIVQNETDIAGKMNANNPTGTGSFSLNRKSGTTIGNHSFAEGWDTEASGSDSHAEGGYTKASGSDSHAEGQGTEASSFGTHAEGLFTEASGPASHAEGLDAKALANASHAQNRGTIAASEDQTAMGRFNIADNHAEYARIVGNGTNDNSRSNAETLDWDGNLTVAGDYTNGNGETLHGAYQAFIDGLPVDSESGNPCVITDAFNTDAKSVKLTLNPIQDLHGYSKPWVGGSGKNKLPMTVNGIKAINTQGTWTGNVYVRDGVTYTIITDSDNNVTGIKANGTASANTGFRIITQSDLNIASGTSLKLNGCTGGSESTYFLDFQYYDNSKDGDSSAFTYDASHPTAFVLINVKSGTSLLNKMFYPMLRLSSITDATFEPYTNICPISGRTQSVVTRTGLNIFAPSNPETFDLTGEELYYRYGHSFNGNATYTIINKSSVAWFYRTPTKDLSDRGTSVTVASGSSTTITVDSSHILWVFATAWDVSHASNVAVNPNSDTTFYPYETATSITRTYGTTIYGGTDDVTGEGATSKYVLVDASSLTWTLITNNRWNAGVISGIKPVLNSEVSSVISDRYEAISADNLYSQTSKIGIAQNVSGELLIRNGSTTTPPTGQILYELATPTSIPLTAQYVTLLHGDNVLTTDADSIECEYSADIALYIAKKIAEGVNSTRSLSKGGSSESTEEVKKEETPKESEEFKEETEETKEEVKEEK